MIGSVYEVVNDDESIRYIGSTTMKLNRRWSAMRSGYRTSSSSSASIYKYFDIHGVDAFHMNLLVDIPVDNRDQLLDYEQRFIDILPCINKNRAYLVNTSNKNYDFYQRNRDKILERNKSKKLCPICHVEYTYSGSTLHLRSKKHINAINKKNVQ